MEEECNQEKCVEDLKLRVETCREELEKQIIEHILNHRSYDREG
jgi:hypothetical protein